MAPAPGGALAEESVLVPEPFDLALVVRSHGWYDLPPWRWDPARQVLGRPLRLGSGRLVDAEVAPAERGLAFHAFADGGLSAAESREARAGLGICLALDEDLEPFRALAAGLEARRAAGTGKDLPDLRWALARGAGRLLRSPTVFEDAVKTLCTTNCTWALTRVMVANLCDKLGEASPLGSRTFPTAAAMAARDERFFRDEIRAGYRAPSLLALARANAEGALDLEALRASPLPTEVVAERISALAGFGPYATEHLLRLLGRHGHLALDSWTRPKLARLRGKRSVPKDATLRRWYAPYGEYAGLAMWLEVTADWHGDRPTWPPRADASPRRGRTSGARPRHRGGKKRGTSEKETG
ncbi:DNA-3-methyladenine glycosylase family protein [Anaeromyxobacter oryzisoli]|uniref:DNA-3-methyladenine glycosylase family protein n=1 Tax=Anaeromyxobacter oryzisoli TaxID=2925408 RepID=UPI001F59A737|nr:Fe-S cluster assembly protein HesB [Anaeromyxobacter sp. SG63]